MSLDKAKPEPTKALDEGLERRDFASSLSSPMVKGTK